MQKADTATLRRKILGVLLRSARMHAGISIKHAAQATGFSSHALYDFEYGRRDISLPQLEALAFLYRIPIAYFWSEDPIPENGHRDFPLEKAMDVRRRIVGVLLRQARIKAGYSQKDLADVLGSTSARIASYEFGRADIPLLELERLAGYLEVPLSYFLDQGISPRGGQIADQDEMDRLAQLPEDVRTFMAKPGNLLYMRVAIQLSTLSAEALRNIAKGLLEITY